MKTQFKPINGEDFMRIVFSGERNLSRIILYPFDYNLETHPYFPGFQVYLEEQQDDLKTNPIILDYSSLVGLIAPSLSIPSTRGKKVNFMRANLDSADLTRAYFRDSDFSNSDLTDAILTEIDFTNANLTSALCIDTDCKYAKFRNANLTGVSFENATLIGADFRGANLDGTNFNSAKLAKVDIRGAKNLEQALNLNLDPRLEIRADKTELDILSQIKAVTDYTYLQGLYQ